MAYSSERFDFMGSAVPFNNISLTKGSQNSHTKHPNSGNRISVCQSTVQSSTDQSTCALSGKLSRLSVMIHMSLLICHGILSRKLKPQRLFTKMIMSFKCMLALIVLTVPGFANEPDRPEAMPEDIALMNACARHVGDFYRYEPCLGAVFQPCLASFSQTETTARAACYWREVAVWQDIFERQHNLLLFAVANSSTGRTSNPPQGQDPVETFETAVELWNTYVLMLCSLPYSFDANLYTHAQQDLQIGRCYAEAMVERAEWQQQILWLVGPQ